MVISEHSRIIERKNKQTEKQRATIFNSLFVESLANDFGVRSTVLEPVNADFPVFAIKQVLESTALDTILRV